MTFRLVVRESHRVAKRGTIADRKVVAGRGTIVVGVVEEGVVTTGQDVQLISPEGVERRGVVKSIRVKGRATRVAKPRATAELLLDLEPRPRLPLRSRRPRRVLDDEGIPPGTVVIGEEAHPTPPLLEPEPDSEDLTLAESPPAGPLLLLPLRIETSFHDTSLRIRVYPDQIHVDSFDPRLTADEAEAGHAYLAAQAGGRPRAEARADLETTLGPRRAMVVAERADREGTDGVREEAVGALSRRAVARGLPRKLIAHGISGGRSFTAQGRPIPEEIPVAPAEGDDAVPGLGGELDWMVEYDRAEELGLALTLHLDADAAASGLDQLYVFGLDADSDGAAVFAELVNSHAHTDGALALPALSPTKGSPQAPPEWASEGASRTGALSLSKALDLTEELSLSRPPEPDPDALVSDFAAIVWDALLRPALTELYAMRPNVLRQLRRVFVHEIRPFGPYATLQLGDQPYATAPISLAREEESTVLGALGRSIRTAMPSVATSATAVRDAARADRGYPWMLETLQRHPVGQQWRLRTMTAAEAYLTPIARAAGTPAARKVAQALSDALTQSRNLLEKLNLEVPRNALVNTALGEYTTPLVCGPLVAAGAADGRSGRTVQDPGIEALLTKQWFWTNRWASMDKDGRPQQKEPEPLLRLLAENAVLQVLTDLAVAEGLVSKSVRRLISESGLQPKGGILLSGSEFLRVRLAADLEKAAGGRNIVDNLTTSTDEGAHHQRELQDLFAALQRANAAPASGAHAAFAAILDCLSTRGDVWLMAEAQQALTEERRKGRRGVTLGGWGVLEDVRPSTTQRPTRHASAPSQEFATTLGLLERARRGLSSDGLDGAVRAELTGPRVSEAREILTLLLQGYAIDAALSRRLAEKLNEAGAGTVMSDVVSALPAEAGASDGFACNGLAFLDLEDVRDLPGIDPSASRVLSRIQADLRLTMTALGELQLADGVTALAQGRVEAAQASLDGLSAGAPPPTDMRALTPSTTGITLDFTMAACAAADRLPRGQLDLRAKLTPRLAALAEQLCGPLAGALVLGDGTQRPLTDLGLSVLSLAYVAAPGSDATTRLADYSRAVLELDEDVVITLDASAEATLWAAGRLGVLLTQSRPLTADDFPAEAAVAVDLAQTSKAHRAAEAVLQEIASTLPSTSYASRTDAAHLFAAGLIATPEVSLVPKAETTITERLHRAQSADESVNALAEILGDMPATPVLRTADDRPFQNGLLLQGASRRELLGWLEESQLVRARLAPVADLMLGAETRPVAALAAQWPVESRPDQQQVDWIGAELREGEAYSARSTLVTVGTELAGDAPFAGLYLDGWQEIIPDARVTAGVIVDSPSPPARPPQLMVLAVHRGDGSPWTVPSVLEALQATVTTAQARTAGLGDLPDESQDKDGFGQLGRILPLGAVRPTDTKLDRAACTPKGDD